jgi:hypothetical protein
MAARRPTALPPRRSPRHPSHVPAHPGSRVITIKDVARESRFAPTTVSMVLNDALTKEPTMKPFLLLCPLGLLAWSASLAGTPPPDASGAQSTPPGQASGTQTGARPISPVNQPIVLFNGKDLSSFYTWVRDTRHEDPRRIFNVAMDQGQPVIHITGDGYGGLITKNEYTNYHLIAEYRWGDRKWGDRANAAKDSGILLHGIGPDGGSTVQRNSALDGRGGVGLSPWLASIEFQIIERGVGDLLILGGDDASGKPLDIAVTVETTRKGPADSQAFWFQKGGEPKRIARGADATRVNWVNKDTERTGDRGRFDADSPGQGWTRLEAIMDGNRMTWLVNGVTVMEASNVTPTAGKLQFQTEMAEIYFRRIELHPVKR